jgi:hypothetical protein
MQHLLVRHTHHAQPMRGQQRIACGIPLALRCMHLTIHLHNQPAGVAVEVHDVPMDNLLPPKVQASQPVLAQLLPQHALRFRHLPPQLFRPLQHRPLDVLSPDHTRPHHTLPAVPGNPMAAREPVA